MTLMIGMFRLLLSLTIALLMPASLMASIPDVKFRRLDTRDGLSNSQVLCVFRDSKGYVWIGTPYGLNRYDGYRVKTYYMQMRDTTSLRSNYVEAIYETKDGKLWLKQGMSYSIFDPVTERCDRHPERWLQEHGIDGGLEFLHIDSKNGFWVKTYNNGFFHYVPETKQLKQYKFGYGAQDFNSELGIAGMTEYGDSLILGTNKGQIITFSRQKDVILSKDTYLFDNKLTGDQDCKPHVDRDGNLWIVTNQGVFVKERKTQHWNNSALELLRSWGIADVPEELQIWDVLADTKHYIWMATDHGGLYCVDLFDKVSRQFLNNKYDESSISDNTLRCLYRDTEGRLWVGSYMNGVNLFVGNTSSFRNLELGVINTICSDKSGYIWLGTNDAGIIRYDKKTGEQVVYNKANSGIGSNTMVGSLAASDGSVWFGTYEGGLIHIKNGQVTNYHATGDTLGLVNNNVWTVHEDQWGNIWIGTLGGGVQRIDKRTGRMRTFRISNSNISSDYISTISRTKKGWLMVAHSKYYSLINPKTFRIVNRELTDKHVEAGAIEMSITGMEDSRGLAWQGSTSGASVWDLKTGKVYLLDMKSGLFGSTVNGIIEDEKHTMWLVTDHGVSNVIPQQQQDGSYTFIVRSYNNRDGLQNGPYNQRSICTTKEGFLLVGGQGGLDILNLRNLKAGRVKEVPMFSGVELSNRDVEVGKEIDGRIILEEALNECRELSLSYQDQFTIQLASSSGEIHNRSRFVYKLDGVNDEWVKTSEQNPNITFVSLRYGDYKLRVRMLNDDGTIGDDEATVDIHVSAPFWRARWAMLFYVLAVLVGVWWWRRYFLRRQAERLELERQRRELEKQQWMSEMRAQMAKEGFVAAQQSPEMPQKRLSFKPVVEELVGFVKENVEHFQMPADKSCKLQFHSSLNRLSMKFDPALLSRAISILVGNSVKFSPNGSRVKVSIANAGPMAEIRIADRGLGIPEGARDHLFEASDIGLDVVKQIVDLHNGKAFAEDNPEGGTIFVVQLPTGDVANDDIPIEDAVLMD